MNNNKTISLAMDWRTAILKATGYTIAGLILLLWSQPAEARYGDKLCSKPGYSCVKIKKGQSWASLFPNKSERMIVQRVNRMNTGLYAGMRIAVPDNLTQANLLDFSPFPATITPPNHKVIIVDPHDLAFGAYDADGNLIHWGPISAGKNYCPDIKRRCHTTIGTYHVYAKQGSGCKSKKFPIGKGGAPMPYCMFFHGGFALHGSPTVPGYNDSHGCVRLFREDAEWLNTQFINLPNGQQSGTKVIINPYL